MISIYSRTYSFTDKFFRLVKYALKIVQKGKTKGNVLKMNSAWIGRNHQTTKQQNFRDTKVYSFTHPKISGTQHPKFSEKNLTWKKKVET